MLLLLLLHASVGGARNVSAVHKCVFPCPAPSPIMLLLLGWRAVLVGMRRRECSVNSQAVAVLLLLLPPAPLAPPFGPTIRVPNALNERDKRVDKITVIPQMAHSLKLKVRAVAGFEAIRRRRWRHWRRHYDPLRRAVGKRSDALAGRQRRATLRAHALLLRQHLENASRPRGL